MVPSSSLDATFKAGMMRGKRVLVTGGATGIGFAIAAAFKRLDADVILVSRKQANLEAACAALGQSGAGSATWHVADVRDAKRLEEIAAAMRAGGASLDALVCCAAGNFPVPFDAMSEHAWKAVIDIVLNGTANTCRAFRPLLQAGSSVTNIVAGYAWTGAPGVAHSGAAKAGVLNLSRTLAVEWAASGIRVNAVSPGPIDGTEGVKRLADDLGLRGPMEKAVPLRRLGLGEEVAAACMFLASPAASYVTGVCIPVDGGMDAKGPFGDMLLGLG